MRLPYALLWWIQSYGRVFLVILSVLEDLVFTPGSSFHIYTIAVDRLCLPLAVESFLLDSPVSRPRSRIIWSPLSK